MEQLRDYQLSLAFFSTKFWKILLLMKLYFFSYGYWELAFDLPSIQKDHMEITCLRWILFEQSSLTYSSTSFFQQFLHMVLNCSEFLLGDNDSACIHVHCLPVSAYECHIPLPHITHTYWFMHVCTLKHMLTSTQKHTLMLIHKLIRCAHMLTHTCQHTHTYAYTHTFKNVCTYNFSLI